MIPASLPLAQATVGHPLFGSQWAALMVVLVGVAVFMVVIAAIGRWLAATHPEPAKAGAKGVATAPATPVASRTPTPEVVAVIAGAIAAELGNQARIAAIRTVPIAPNIETLMQQWSLEGRRQIYTSHQVR